MRYTDREPETPRTSIGDVFESIKAVANEAVGKISKLAQSIDLADKGRKVAATALIAAALTTAGGIGQSAAIAAPAQDYNNSLTQMLQDPLSESSKQQYREMKAFMDDYKMEYAKANYQQKVQYCKDRVASAVDVLQTKYQDTVRAWNDASIDFVSAIADRAGVDSKTVLDNMTKAKIENKEWTDEDHEKLVQIQKEIISLSDQYARQMPQLVDQVLSGEVNPDFPAYWDHRGIDGNGVYDANDHTDYTAEHVYKILADMDRLIGIPIERGHAVAFKNDFENSTMRDRFEKVDNIMQRFAECSLDFMDADEDISLGMDISRGHIEDLAAYGSVQNDYEPMWASAERGL